jgi:hypothetical protein
VAIATVQPLFLKDVEVSIAGNDYGAGTSSVTFTPSFSVQKFIGLKPTAIFTDLSQVEWTADLTFAQDWDSKTPVLSLSRYLFVNQGKAIVMTFRPRTGVGPTFTATVTIVPGSIGGAQGGAVTATISMPVNGAPALSDAA